MLEHKTFHRYTVRARRGTSQGTRDAHGCMPKSAGASLRRYNEAALLKVSVGSRVAKDQPTWGVGEETCLFDIHRAIFGSAVLRKVAKTVTVFTKKKYSSLIWQICACQSHVSENDGTWITTTLMALFLFLQILLFRV